MPQTTYTHTKYKWGTPYTVLSKLLNLLYLGDHPLLTHKFISFFVQLQVAHHLMHLLLCNKLSTNKATMIILSVPEHVCLCV